MGNEMASGEPSYGMAIMSGRRSGKLDGVGLIGELRHMNSRLREERDGLRSRCEMLEIERDRLKTDVEYLRVDLKGWQSSSRLWYSCFMDMLTPSAKMETERDEVLARCEKLNAMCIELATDYAKAEAERDEARQWARKFKLAYEETEQEAVDALDTLTNAGKESIVEISDYAVELQNKLKAENADLRAQSAIDNVRMVGMADEIDGLRKELAEARNKALSAARFAVDNVLFRQGMGREVIAAAKHAIFVLRDKS